jgi:hypothetical protein
MILTAHSSRAHFVGLASSPHRAVRASLVLAQKATTQKSDREPQARATDTTARDTLVNPTLAACCSNGMAAFNVANGVLIYEARHDGQKFSHTQRRRRNKRK